jgi:hypothetical protein
VRTNLGWCPPAHVLAGKPVFGNRRPFAPQVPGADRLWAVLQIRAPALSDCLAVLVELARTRTPLDVRDQTIALETLRLLAELVGEEALAPAVRRRLARLPVWTTQGWQTARPVYAIDDPALALGLATEAPVWQPGGELGQFRGLLSHLRLTELAADSTTVVDAAAADVDEEATALLRAAVPLLREDLARNDPTTEAASEVGWDRLAAFQVRVNGNLRVRVGGLADGPRVFLLPPRPTRTLLSCTSTTQRCSRASTAEDAPSRGCLSLTDAASRRPGSLPATTRGRGVRRCVSNLRKSKPPRRRPKPPPTSPLV